MQSFLCVLCTWPVMAWVNAEAVEDTGVPAIILGLICLRWRLTDRGMRLVATKPQRSSWFHLTVCGDLFIYILILLFFIYVSVWVCLLVCVCTSLTPLETSSSGSYTCRKKRVAGRTALPECAPAPGWEISKERWPLLNSKGTQASSTDWNPAEAFI